MLLTAAEKTYMLVRLFEQPAIGVFQQTWVYVGLLYDALHYHSRSCKNTRHRAPDCRAVADSSERWEDSAFHAALRQQKNFKPAVTLCR